MESSVRTKLKNNIYRKATRGKQFENFGKEAKDSAKGVEDLVDRVMSHNGNFSILKKYKSIQQYQNQRPWRSKNSY